MKESAHCYHHAEWPAPGSRVRGPLLLLHGWAVGKPDCAILDVRARVNGRTVLGIYGLPRVDLAAHFQAERSWLPAEFVIAVPVTDGSISVVVECMDIHGQWRRLEEIACTVAPDGEENPRAGGEYHPDRAWLTRSPHAPFHGHLDEPVAERRHGRTPVFGWLLHAEQAIKRVFASTDLLTFNHLEHGIADDSLAAKVPAMPQARLARLRGEVNAPATLIAPTCLRVYAQLADDSVHLCFAQRFTPTDAPKQNFSALTKKTATPPTALAARPSGRPWRLLLGTRNLNPDDATLRALDAGRHLLSKNSWALRLVTTVDGPLRRAFEDAGIAVQIVDPRNFFSAPDKPAVDAALAALAKQIWWQHLDATVAFDPVCDWLLTLARRAHVPAFADWPTAQTGAADNEFLNFSLSALPWHSAELATTPRAEARAQLSVPADVNLVVFPCAALATDGAQHALQAAAWLAARSPIPAARWRFVLLGGRQTSVAQALRRDAALSGVENFLVLNATDARWLTAADVVGHVGSDDATLRPLLDAAALGTPIMASRDNHLAEFSFSRTDATLISPNNPLALAHALLDHAANPAAATRRAHTAQARVRQAHDPHALLARWQETLESAIADRALKRPRACPRPAPRLILRLQP